jgi:hypothetical protein
MTVLEATHQKTLTYLERCKADYLDHGQLSDISLVIVGLSLLSDVGALSKLSAACESMNIAGTTRELETLTLRGRRDLQPLVIWHAEVTGELCDALFAFRQYAPYAIVILSSPDIKRDDFTLEKGAFCDVAVRMPYTTSTLARAVQAARQNQFEMKKRGMYHWAPE